MKKFKMAPLESDVLKDLAEKVAKGAHLPEIAVYEHRDFQGWEFRTNLNVLYVGDAWKDEISSIIVVSGKWQFYIAADFIQPTGPVLGPGYYEFIGDNGLLNDAIASFKCVEW